KRLWLQSMTKEAIKDAFAHLRDNNEMLTLEDAALCRSESDWLIGINATRALTGFNSRRGGFFLTPCGRVQTPTLSLIVKREQARLNFVHRTYFNLLSTFTFDQGSYVGKWIDPQFVKDKQDNQAKADRIWDEKKADQILAGCTGKQAIIEETSKKVSERSPQLYDLTSLQREANSRFGFSAKNTLGLAQALYERHKVLTYPRTDSRCLPEDYLATVQKTVTAQTAWTYGQFAETALSKKFIKPEKLIFNNAKISDHHAIIPTTVLPKTLTEPELKIYTMVVQRFLAVFFPPARYLNARRISVVETESFLTEGKILTDPGWKAIYGSEIDQEQEVALSPIPAGAEITCAEISKEKAETKPPARFNEATLLSAMENSDKLVEDEELAEAMKERGLGTPATRAAIIEKLLKEKYLVREGKELTPTGKAFNLFSLLEAMKIELLASPEMTGEWEHKLNQILHGKFTRRQFMAEIRETTEHIISQVRNFDRTEVRAEAPFSPVNNIHFYTSPTAFISEDEKITIRKILGGRIMSEAEIGSMSIHDILHKDSRKSSLGLFSSISRISQVVEHELLFVTKSGKTIVVEGSITTQMEEGTPVAVRGIFRDITKRKQLEERFLEQKNFTEKILRYSAVPIFVLNKNHEVTIWNKACETMTGIPAEKIVGTSDHWQAFYPSKRDCLADLVLDEAYGSLPQFYEAFENSAFMEEGVRSEGWFDNIGGIKRYLAFDAVPIYNRANELVAAIETLQDISERKKMEEDLERLATTDALTGLCNRHRFNELLQQEVDRAKRYNTPLSLIMFDLDHFKKIQGNFGETYKKGEKSIATLKMEAKQL
ncbi:MAG: PAS domain S-box protein, partial [Proteobacteria bacterium]|nr:PAS domain S-box protein [Pseudomonadota bacterium]